MRQFQLDLRQNEEVTLLAALISESNASSYHLVERLKKAATYDHRGEDAYIWIYYFQLICYAQ